MSTPGAALLDADIVSAFVENFLLADFDNAHPITAFQMELWREACCDDPYVALAAPRGHSKSTSINHAFGLASALFKTDPFQLKISRTRGIAIEYLQAAKQTLTRNRKIQLHFGFKRFVRDTEDDFIAEFTNGYQCRMMAFGAEQAIRGATWDTRRPSLVICDDMEDDEQVASADRREKLWRWFMNAVLPVGSTHTRFRVVGTILHIQSMLQRLLESPSWRSRRYEGCNEDLSWLLWPEMYPREWWVRKRQQFVDAGNLIGFNMEYRNIAIDTSSGFFQPPDFVDYFDNVHASLPHTFYVGGDFAISKKERRDHTVFEIGGLDPDGYLDVVDERRGRWDSNQIIEEMFVIEDTYHPEAWFVESGQIFKTLEATLTTEMRKRGVYLNLRPMIPVKEKMLRARPLQKRMRSKSVRFDKRTTWFADLEQEFMQFRGLDEPNDRVDALAWLAIGLANASMPATLDEEEEWAYERERSEHLPTGRNRVTGY